MYLLIEMLNFVEPDLERACLGSKGLRGLSSSSETRKMPLPYLWQTEKSSSSSDPSRRERLPTKGTSGYPGFNKSRVIGARGSVGEKSAGGLGGFLKRGVKPRYSRLRLAVR